MTLINEEKVFKKPVVKTDKTIDSEKSEVKSTRKPIIKNTEKEVSKEKVERTQKLEKKDDRTIRTIRSKNIEKKIIVLDKVSSESKKETPIDKLGRSYATGKRKNAIAKVWLKKGSGKIIINGKEANEYLQRPILEVVINVPFVVTNTQEKFDVICTTLGGGLSGQAGAIRHGISKALETFNIIYRPELKAAGLLTRDSRVVERKKAGLIKARKGQVYKRR